MFEKVNRHHPDKIADRIAGAIVDLAYSKSPNPKVACEVMIGHGRCFVINETSEPLSTSEVCNIVRRIAGDDVYTEYIESRQDIHLSENQEGMIRCGDNGIFKGVVPTLEEELLSYFSSRMDYFFDSDGKYIIDWKDMEIHIIICQSQPSELGKKRIHDDLGIDVSKYSLDDLIDRLGLAILKYWGDDISRFQSQRNSRRSFYHQSSWRLDWRHQCRYRCCEPEARFRYGTRRYGRRSAR